MQTEIETGKRVGAIMSATKEQVKLFGYGYYVGDKVPPKEISPALNSLKIPNPKIILDSGKVVWGFECWWAPEEQVLKNIADRAVVLVEIDEERGRVK